MPPSKRPHMPRLPDTPGAEAAGWDQLGAIRRARMRSGPTLELRRMFLSRAPEIRRLKKQLALVAEAWERVIPAELVVRTRLEGISRGILRVCVSDSAAAFELDRVLRSGAEAMMLSQTPVSLRSVRVVVSSGGISSP
jgi:hypothetical protein